MTNSEPFAEPARLLITKSQEVARGTGHRHIGTEHIALHSLAAALHRALTGWRDQAQLGTRVTLSVTVPDEPERRWSWCREDEGAT